MLVMTLFLYLIIFFPPNIIANPLACLENILNVFEVSYAHQSDIYLIKITVKTAILWNVMIN